MTVIAVGRDAQAAGLLLGALLLLATCAGATTAAAAPSKRVLGRDAVHVLFAADTGIEGRSLLKRGASSAISYETLRVVDHPLRADMRQKKVQQTHAGLELFGHSFVVGLAADGVTEQAEGTYGTIFTGLDQVIPDATPTLTPSDANEVVLSITEDGSVASTKLIIWIEKEESNSAHLAYLVTLLGSSSGSSSSAAGVPMYVLVDAKDGQVLRAWRQQRTQHVPRPRQQDSSTATTQTTNPAATQTLPQTTDLASTSSHDSHVRRGLLQSRSKYVNIWAVGGNTKVGRIYYNGSSSHNPALQVTKSGRNCFFVSKYVKTADILQVYTREEWQDKAINNFTAAAGYAWASKNFSQVDRYYEDFPAVGYVCPAAGQYVQTSDETKGSYSQHADIQAIMSLIFDMWKNWLGVDLISIFTKAGVPTPLLVIPHADPALDNAFWSDWFFACGDGNETFYPLCTSGDVLAHELGHGVTSVVNSGLLYFGQSGAWNEGFSDMIGMAYNFYDSGRVNPLIGADIMLDAPCLRNMSDPALYDQSASTLNLTSKDPHDLSGVPNLAFYKLATSHCYDPKVAMLVAQRAAHLYFTPTTSFADGAAAWVRAAQDLGYDSSAVRQAWQGVGLWQACGDQAVTVSAGDFDNPDIPPDSPFFQSFFGAANTSVYIGNLTYDGEINTAFNNNPGLNPCGLSIALKTQTPTTPLKHARPSMYVGINRMPDPFTPGEWDCKMDMEVGAAGPAQPGCDLPALPNTTYHVVAHSMESWGLQAFSWTSWGPVLGDAAAGEDATCFNGGTCTADSDCTSGFCILGYCSKKRS